MIYIKQEWNSPVVGYQKFPPFPHHHPRNSFCFFSQARRGWIQGVRHKKMTLRLCCYQTIHSRKANLTVLRVRHKWGLLQSSISRPLNKNICKPLDIKYLISKNLVWRWHNKRVQQRSTKPRVMRFRRLSNWNLVQEPLASYRSHIRIM